MDRRRLKFKAILGVVTTPIMHGAPIFIAAGTFDYWQAWLFLVVFTIVTALFTAYFYKHDPALLERRMRIGPAAEERLVQRVAVGLVMIAFLLAVIIAGLDRRYHWSAVPAPMAIVGDVCVVLSYVGFFYVMRENSFAAATIQIAEDQKVISTGPYALVRHPMYSAAVLLMVAMPVALGSWWGLAVVPFTFIALLFRIQDEEKYLVENLPGYEEYRTTVKYRLLPGVY